MMESSFSEKHKGGLAVLYIFLGGVVGTTVRELFEFLQPSSIVWPWATFLINICGAFILGLMTGVLALRASTTGRKLFSSFFGTGMMGAFTTYGTFVTETERYLKGWIAMATLYALASIILGIFAAWCGFAVASAVVKPENPAAGASDGSASSAETAEATTAQSVAAAGHVADALASVAEDDSAEDAASQSEDAASQSTAEER